jgi:hypothetical protein
MALKPSMDDDECEPRAINGHGGKRPGAGRPRGSKNQRSAEIAQQAIEAGITPIEVMLTAMRDFWAEGTPEAKREAAIIARHAAPYIHPRLANIDQTIHEHQQYTREKGVVRGMISNEAVPLSSTSHTLWHEYRR